MKKIIIVLAWLPFFIGCSKSNDEMDAVSPKKEIVTNPIESSGIGDFVARAHPTSGKVAVNKDKTKLSFLNFETDNGPKLVVYLSTDISSSEYVDLGKLKGVKGNYTYDIPANTDLEKFKIVNIWCVDFSVSFGTAELK